jgi:hypothetical protein
MGCGSLNPPAMIEIAVNPGRLRSWQARALNYLI